MKNTYYLKFSIFIFILLSTYKIIKSTAYVTNQGGHSISIVNTATNTVSGTVNDPFSTFNVVSYVVALPNSTKAYASNQFDGVSIIDIPTNTVTGTVSDSGHTFNGPFQMVLSPDATKLYVVNTHHAVPNTGNISVVDTSTDTVIANITSSSFSEIFSIAVTSDGTKGYVTNRSANTVSILNLTNNTVTGHVSDPSSTFGFPNIVTISPDNTKAYVCNESTFKVSIINIATDTVIGTVNDPDNLFSGNAPIGAIFKTDGTTAYIATANTLVTVNAITDTTTGTIPGAVNGFQFLTIAPGDTKMYAPTSVHNNVAIFDIVNNTFMGNVSDPNSTLASPSSTAFFPLLGPPANVNACMQKNIFLTQVDNTNVLTWNAPASGEVPVSYNIYRDAALTDLAATILATQPLIFVDHNLLPNSIHTYYIVSVDQGGTFSDSVGVSAISNC